MGTNDGAQSVPSTTSIRNNSGSKGRESDYEAVSAVSLDNGRVFEVTAVYVAVTTGKEKNEFFDSAPTPNAKVRATYELVQDIFRGLVQTSEGDQQEDADAGDDVVTAV